MRNINDNYFFPIPIILRIPFENDLELRILRPSKNRIDFFPFENDLELSLE